MSPIRECFCRSDNLPNMQGHTLCGNIVPKMWRRRKDNGAAIHPTDDTRAVRHHYATNSIVNSHAIKLLNSLKRVLTGRSCRCPPPDDCQLLVVASGEKVKTL